MKGISISIHKEFEALIQHAFQDVRYPGDDNLVALGREATGEPASIAARLKGKKWSDLDTEEIIWHQASLSMLLPAALHYYLPAFLIASLEPDKVGFVFDALLWTLSPSFYEGGSTARFDELVRLLSDEQRIAIRLFFDYARDTYPQDFAGDAPETTLTTYWTDGKI